jgi:proline iminopeptidase
MRLGDAYFYHPSPAGLLREKLHGGWRTHPRGEPLIFAGQHLLDGWSVMDRLGEVTAPTLVLAGREDFLYPPEHQMELALGIPDATLRIIERAGHNPHYERPADVMKAVTRFVLGEPNRPMPTPAADRRGERLTPAPVIGFRAAQLHSCTVAQSHEDR